MTTPQNPRLTDTAGNREDTPTKSTALLLTPEEAAYELNVSRTRVFSLMGSGDLPRIRIGGRVRIARRSLEEYVDKLIEQSQLAS